ncbi:hypothetical protein [Streptomyces cinnamoneus]|uniref:hypothetical protein n=1 Tax=Streptomyces cinnamoneus TaxID=53446 RepID=UPI00379B3A24
MGVGGLTGQESTRNAPDDRLAQPVERLHSHVRSSPPARPPVRGALPPPHPARRPVR